MEGKNKGKGNKIDRREFLKKLGIAGLGAILGSGKFFKGLEIASVVANPEEPEKPPRLPKVPSGVWEKAIKRKTKYKL